jgi:flagella basal body P-ring formation protein FlgA
MNTHRALSLLFLWTALEALGLLPAPAEAAAWQDHGAIRGAAERAAMDAAGADGARVAARADALDPRLRLPACGAPLAAETPAAAKGGRVTVEVRCPAGQGWRLFVPVRVTVTRTVVVAARSLARDAVLAPGDVQLAERDVSTLPYGYLPAADLALGRQLRRGLAPGDVLTPALVAEPVVVRRGQSVTLEARGRGLRVVMPGIARAEGAAGERIPVENARSGRIVQAVVRDGGTVEIRLD